MTDRPIPFRHEMVGALRAGRKIITRRKLYSERRVTAVNIDQSKTRIEADRGSWKETCSPPDNPPDGRLFIPSGWHRLVRGDRLWVKEPWCAHGGRPSPSADRIVTDRAEIRQRDGSIWRPSKGDPLCIFYRETRLLPPYDHLKWEHEDKMPRYASRMTLIVQTVRLERLQEITEADAEAEGCLGQAHRARDVFESHWRDMFDDTPFDWHSNPWVARIHFLVRRSNIDELAE